VGETVELQVTALVAGGDGLARHDGLAVFVPRTAVGDAVRASMRPRGRFARATVESVLVASPDRVDAPCVHYTRDGCGGCQWQHVALEAQRSAKARIVADAFERLARQPITRPVVHGDAHPFGYRRTVRLTVRGRGQARVGGFHAANDPDQVVDVVTCALAEPTLQSAWSVVRAGLSRLPVTRQPHVPSRGASVTSRAGRGRAAPFDDVQVTLRRLDDGSVALAIDGGTQWRDADIAWFGRTVPRCRGIWWTPARGGRRLVWDADAAVPLAPTVEAADALSLAASFVQVNAGMADQLHTHVLSSVRAFAPAHVVDAYAGSGRLAMALQRAGVSVTAIERDAAAAAYASAQLAERAGQASSSVLTGAVEDRLGEALPADVVVLNPPRGGCDARVCELLSRAQPSATPAPRAIVYVSCDPATLARDVSRLSGWRVSDVTCFDLFPQTAHVETVCVLQPETT
jgi:23S rRNA (uracil1939-C5)-methyltransferase